MLHTPFYDPEKTYEENFAQGPFGAFADGEVIKDYGGNASVPLPRYDFLGFKVNSLFGIAAGPLINGKFVKAALDKGFDIVTYKTVRSGKYPSHPWPNVLSVKVEGDLNIDRPENALVADRNYQEPLSITNSFGVPSKDPEFWQKDMAEVVRYAESGQIVIGSFQGTKREGQTTEDYINDYKICAEMLKATGVKIFEINLSCPNEGTSNFICFDIEKSAKITKLIKKTIGEIPLIVKIAYYKDFEALKDFVKEIGPMVQAISPINGMNSAVVDESGKQALPGEGRSRSGICGHAIKWAGLDMVKKLKKLREELGLSYTIIGVGGCTTADDFFEYRDAGADAVMSATGAMWNPYLAKEIKSRLSAEDSRLKSEERLG